MARDKTIPKSVEETLEYFLRNPHAADSLEGVARWRLLDQRVHRTVDEVDQALRWLLANGLLVETETTAGPSVFSLDPTSVDAARDLLAGLRNRRSKP